MTIVLQQTNDYCWLTDKECNHCHEDRDGHCPHRIKVTEIEKEKS